MAALYRTGTVSVWEGVLCSGVSVQGLGLCPGVGVLSRGVFVQGGLCPGVVSFQRVSFQGISV